MKKINYILIVVGFFFTGCAAQWEIGEEPFFRFGERVIVVNNTRYNLHISYRTWGEASTRNLAPGQEGVISGLRSGEYLVARAFDHGGEVIGTATLRIRSSRQGGPQLWTIRSIRRLR